jgi:hypothetical protein
VDQEIFFFQKLKKGIPLSAAAFYSSSSILIDFSALMTRVCYGAVTAPCTWARENPRFVREAMAPFDIYITIKCWLVLRNRGH